MTRQFPQRTRSYRSLTTDTGIWDRFRTRPDDVFISTPPKCGTTWMQSICAMLIFADPGIDPGLGNVSRWLDSAFNEEGETIAALEAQKHRRYLKTHTPLDGMTYDPDCTYVTVYRHPLDAAFSGQNHIRNMKSDELDHLLAADANAFILQFTSAPFSTDQVVGENLEGLIAHYLSFAQWRDLPNIHLFHYADMKRDLRGAVQRLSGLLGYDHDDAFLDRVAEAATFANMKGNAAMYAPSANRGIWKEDANFFESGSSNKWKGVLTQDTLDVYAARMNELLAPEARRWLEYGGTP